jgi:hypothetical protein
LPRAVASCNNQQGSNKYNSYELQGKVPFALSCLLYIVSPCADSNINYR